MRSKASWGYDADFMRQSRQILQVTPERMLDWQLRVASDAAGRLLGVCGHSVEQTSTGLAAELELMFVEPDAMRIGVGRALFADLRARLHAQGVSALWILSDPGAEAFYSSQGAVRAGLHPSDAIVGRELPWLRLSSERRIPTLLSERLRLRAWRPEDRIPFAALNADPRVNEHLPGPISREESDRLAEHIQRELEQHGFGLWAVERLDEPARFIGFAGLSVPGFRAAFTPSVEIGWRLAAEHWGRGLATEAARVVLRHAFDRLGLEQLVSFTVPANRASRRVMEKLGMRRDPGEDFAHPALAPEHRLSGHVLYRISSGSV